MRRYPSTYNNKNIYISPSSEFFQKLGVNNTADTWIPAWVRCAEIIGGVIDHVVSNSKDESKGCLRLRTIDIGCGEKGFLLYSLHAYLYNKYLTSASGVDSSAISRSRVISVQTQGIDRDPLVLKCNEIARKLGREFESLTYNQQILEANRLKNNLFDADGLSFNSTEGMATLDVLVATHFCDTLTDDAIWFGITRNVDIIVFAPCCYNQLRPYINDDDKNRLITDSMRAMLLDIAGYDVQLLPEKLFSELPDDLLFTAVKRSGNDHDGLSNDKHKCSAFDSLVSMYGVRKHRLATLMGLNLMPPKQKTKHRRNKFKSFSGMPVMHQNNRKKKQPQCF
jgi:hypothetical protein